MIVKSRIQPRPLASGFTIIEIMVVVSIIALLAAISIGVGASMADAGRKRATEGVLQALDQALIDYMSATGSIPAALVAIKLDQDIGANSVGDTVYYPVIDGRFDLVIPDSDPEENYEINSIGLFIHSIKGATDVDALMSQIDGEFIKTYDVPDDLQPGMLTVFDAWGNPIRYVHPKFDGIIESGRRVIATAGDFLDVMDLNSGYFTAEYLPDDVSLIPFTDIRRNKILTSDRIDTVGIESDSDGGICPGQRPYFYSSGPDGDPATVEDNVYTSVPDFIDPL